MSTVPGCDHEANTASGDTALLCLQSIGSSQTWSVVWPALRLYHSDLQSDTLKARGDELIASYHSSRSVATLEHAISIYEEALRLRITEHERRAESLNDLGDALYHFCSRHEADKTRASHCIELLREGLRLRPSGHLLRDQSLHNLARALRDVLYQHLSRLDILMECASLDHEALLLRPSGHPDRSKSLNNLAVDLMTVVECTGDTDKLAEIISMYREVLQTRPPGHPMRHTALHNLACALCMSFRHLGRSELLAEAIGASREVVQLRPLGHPLRHWAMANLAHALALRSVYEGRSELLVEAIDLQRESLLLLPGSSQRQAMGMCNLAQLLLASFRNSGDGNALDEALSLSREAVALHSSGGYEDVFMLNNLSEVLEKKLDKDSGFEALSEVANLHREVLHALPDGHWQRFWSLEGLARVLCRMGSPSWPEALSCYQEALQICPTECPERTQLLSGMSKCFLDPRSPLFSLSEGISCLSKAYADPFMHVNGRLKSAISDLQQLEAACRTFKQCAHPGPYVPDDGRISTLYAQVIGLLPLAANFGIDHSARLQAVAGTDEIARNAAARALLIGNIPQAIETLELGRGVFWMQTHHLHTIAFDGVPEDDCQELQ
jgi:tetratricopeptide (TPR) repeat protein